MSSLFLREFFPFKSENPCTIINKINYKMFFFHGCSLKFFFSSSDMRLTARKAGVYPNGNIDIGKKVFFFFLANIIPAIIYVVSGRNDRKNCKSKVKLFFL